MVRRQPAHLRPVARLVAGAGADGVEQHVVVLLQEGLRPGLQVPPPGQLREQDLGPVAPHWEVHGVFGDGRLIDEFRQRAIARLQLLPPHDPQFRRNRERVNRDAERERLIIDWDLGYEETEPS